MSTQKQKIPPATSLIYGLRCIGYNFSTALADIIDNSISAEAKNILILSDPDVDDPYLCVFDDGCGMGRKELDNAMTLGSNRDGKDDSELELGRFGLGLKSASFSQCLKLTVASKRTNKINAMRYDLLKIQSLNEWVIEELDDDEIKALPEIEKLIEADSGTLVIWQNFDKLQKESSSFRDSFFATVMNAKRHIEFVFHRFWSDVNIEFNGHRIEKRDPFLSELPNSQKGRTQIINIDGQSIVVTPFVLPFANSLTEEHKKMLGNPKSIYDDQGFYIYRNKRLIIWGSWLHMNIRSEFNKLARVRVDVPSSLDSLWMLDVKKSSAKIPDKIKLQLQSSVKDSIVRSKREVRYPGKKEAEAQCPLWNRVNLQGGKVRYEINRESSPIYKELIDLLDDNQIQLLNAYLDKVEKYLPKGMIVADNADSLQIINSGDEDKYDDLLEELIHIVGLSKNPEVAVQKLLQDQAYIKLASYRDEIIRRVKDDK